MKLKIISVGSHIPAWVAEAFKDYNQRLPRHLQPQLIEIPLGKRHKNYAVDNVKNAEADEVLKAIKPQDHVIALEVGGKPWSTDALSKKLQAWQQQGHDVILLVGGPDGLAQKCLERANSQWSLSALTLPHPIVRVILIEQIYRAWSLLAGHPYHR